MQWGGNGLEQRNKKLFIFVHKLMMFTNIEQVKKVNENIQK
jgi:hypothetical protein